MSLFPRPSQNCLERQTLTNLPPGPHAGVWPQPRRQREKLREETENPCHNAPLPAGAESLPPSCKPEMSWAGVSGDQAGMSEAHSPGGTAGEVRDPEKQQQGGRGQVSRQARRGDRGAAGQRAGVAHTAAGGGGGPAGTARSPHRCTSQEMWTVMCTQNVDILKPLSGPTSYLCPRARVLNLN